MNVNGNRLVVLLVCLVAGWTLAQSDMIDVRSLADEEDCHRRCKGLNCAMDNLQEVRVLEMLCYRYFMIPDDEGDPPGQPDGSDGIRWQYATEWVHRCTRVYPDWGQQNMCLMPGTFQVMLETCGTKCIVPPG